MKQNKWCCRIFPIVLIVVSAIIAAAIWYFGEAVHEFRFLTDGDEFFNYLGTVLFVSIIPIGLFYWLTDKEKYREKAKQISLLGFLPAFVLLVFTIL